MVTIVFSIIEPPGGLLQHRMRSGTSHKLLTALPRYVDPRPRGYSPTPNTMLLFVSVLPLSGIESCPSLYRLSHPAIF
jgi:hypothetical protein